MSYNTTSSRFNRFCDTNNDVLVPRPTSRDRSPNAESLTGPQGHHHHNNNIPQRPPAMASNDDTLQCCCGRSSCAYLQHNNAALGGLEHDLDMAAKMGQALLSRHESYMAESEAMRTSMSSQISHLEGEKSALQTANEKIVAQNRDLLDQLEGLNASLTDSDEHVRNLEATLASTQMEVRRLEGLARRAEELEGELRSLQREKNRATEEVVLSKEEERSALGRWREAELRLRDMAREVERIEGEARREREVHAEMMRRMEMERSLGVSEGRLKGIAASKGVDNGTGGRNVVSHFVRDILQDNANLQAGIVELRELLQTSNEEVQGLREQIVQHQPVSPSETDVPGTVDSLEDQMGWGKPKQVSQEVHVHHHYHAKFATKKEKLPVRRNSRKRTSIGQLGTTPESSIPSTPATRPQQHFSSPIVPVMSIEQQPIAPRNRWSVQSAATGSTNLSSMPSSPHSYFEHRNMSIFDRLEEDAESSRPTSPESAGYASPKLGVNHRHSRPSDFSLASFAEETEDYQSKLHDLSNDTAQTLGEGQLQIQEAVIDAGEDHIDTTQQSPLVSPDPEISERHPLRRTTSHDSLVSISGMDIHLAKRKPSQIFVLTRPSGPSPARTISTSMQPLARIAEINASSSKNSISSKSQSMAMLAGLRREPPPPPQQRGLGKLVGGWVRGSWGIAPMRSTGDLRTQTANTAAIMSRPMGINQQGAVPGLRPPMRTPSEVRAKVLDAGLLKEALGE